MQLMERFPYIVVEGPIGSGKTTLAHKLADRYNAQLLVEQAEANPFLTRFYQEPGRYALQTQLFFLFQRGNQLRELAQRDLFGAATVADFFLEKDPLFARITLDNQEFQLYRQIFQHLQVQAPAPDLVIYLQTPLDALQERVQQRNISYEQNISRDYLHKLSDAYSEFFHQYDAAPLLIVNNDKLNIATEDASLTLLIERIMQMRGRREFFNPNLQ